MTEYSKEWIEQENNGMTPDFSIESMFKKLKVGESKSIICEGFGITKIINDDDVCYVEIKGKKDSSEKALGMKFEKDDSFKPFWWYVFVVVVLWTASLFLVPYFFSKNIESESIFKGMTSSSFGDMFGGVNALFSGLALAGIIFTIFLQRKELKLQRKELRSTREEFQIQNETLKRQRFENTFFQMLTLHHEIIDKLKYGEIEKRAIFQSACEGLKSGLSTYPLVDKSLNNVKEQINSSYRLAFQYIEPILSHYFRNLYHIFKYIYKSNLISKEEKKFYAGIVRAQLSSDELYLLYYNSLVKDLGNPKFLFLVKEFNILKNMNPESVTDEVHKQVFRETIENVKNPFISTNNQD